jgi:peptide-methionine (S)-S-oxide reductase
MKNRTALMMKPLMILARLASSLVLLALAAPSAAAAAPPARAHLETAVLAGGCFWGLEAVFERLRGVTQVESGFSGGDADTAHYEMVSTGTTGHAESVRISFDPAQISYATLLNVYFTVATDPTELNRQGPDEGTQYRSEIFYLNAQQKHVAESTIASLTAAHAFGSPIVTKIEPMRGFYAAEAYHQHFYDRNPTYPYIVYNDKPKVEQLHLKFPQLVKADN